MRNIHASSYRVSDAGEGMAALPTVSDQACNENADDRAQERCANAPRNLVEQMPFSGQSLGCERGRQETGILRQRCAQFALTGNEAQECKSGQQERGGV